MFYYENKDRNCVWLEISKTALEHSILIGQLMILTVSYKHTLVANHNL